MCTKSFLYLHAITVEPPISDHLIDVLTTFLDLECGSCIAESSDLIKNIWISVPKMNEGLERQEGE